MQGMGCFSSLSSLMDEKTTGVYLMIYHASSITLRRLSFINVMPFLHHCCITCRTEFEEMRRQSNPSAEIWVTLKIGDDRCPTTNSITFAIIKNNSIATALLCFCFF